MPDKFKGKYRIASARLPNWDYARDGAYFITICTKNREHYFGEIVNGAMQYNHAGIIAYIFWHEIKNHAFNIELGEFIVMPNHIHGILILDGNDVNVVDPGHALDLPNALGLPNALDLPSPPSPSPPSPPPPKTPPSQSLPHHRFQNPGKNSISSIVGSYKSAVTKYCNRLQIPFAWQTRFHDHIIRDAAAFERISAYIKNNPANWKEDKFYEP